jgi:Holliday junction resolvase
MGAGQRRKGAAGERELAQVLSEQLGWVVSRKLGQARDGGDDIQTGKFRWECKRRKKLAVYEFMDQITAACGSGDVPVVAMRADGKGWLVMMKLEDALPLIRGELPQR